MSVRAGLDHRHHRRRPARPDAGDRRGAARLSLPHLRPARAPVRGRCRRRSSPAPHSTTRDALRALRRGGRRRHLRVRESARRRRSTRSAPSCGPARARWRRAGPRGRESSSSSDAAARVAPWRAVDGQADVDAAVERARAAAGAQEPAATATTARARPGSATPARRARRGTRSARSPRLPKPRVDFAPNFRSSLARSADGDTRFWDRAAQRPRRRHPAPLDRARRRIDRGAGATRRVRSPRAHRRGARPCRRADGRILRLRRRARGQRDRAARPQQRPLDDRGRRDLAVRAAYPRHLRPAARADRRWSAARSRWTI